MLIISDVTIIHFIICLNPVVVPFGLFLSNKPILMLEIVSKSGILIIRDGFKLLVRIETEDHAEAIVKKTKDRISKDEHLHTRVSSQVAALLDGDEEIGHKVNCKENADEDEDHYHLIADLPLNHKQNKEKENTKDGLLKELRNSNKVEDYDYCLYHHQHSNYCYVSTCFFSCWLHSWAKTHG